MHAPPPQESEGGQAGRASLKLKRVELKKRVEVLETRLQRGRLTIPAYGAGTLFFLGTGVYTGSWPPAITVAGLCALLGLATLRLRKRWAEQIVRLHKLERRLDEVEGGDFSDRT